jgi:uncharacterized membrane protein YeaQ/YmgE (transglycosylase-associated protein family)
MATLSFVLAAFLDPIQAGIVLAVVLVHRGALPVIVAGVVAAVVSESIMALAADDYMWGEFVAPRLVSSLMQAAVLCWVVRWVRSLRAGGSAAPAGAGGSAGNAAAAFGSLGGRGALPHASRTPPLHARAHLRRRMGRLRIR